MSDDNPFRSYGSQFENQMQDQGNVFSASAASGQNEQQARIEESYVQPIGVALPPHLFIPANAQSIDISANANIPPATTVSLLRYESLPGGLTKFIGYSIFNDALMLSLLDLVPTVNGIRVLPFHGNPQLNFKMGLGLGSDLASLISCQLDLSPGDVLEWFITNNDVVDIAVGVRMSGYFDQVTIKKTGFFGG